MVWFSSPLFHGRSPLSLLPVLLCVLRWSFCGSRFAHVAIGLRVSHLRAQFSSLVTSPHTRSRIYSGSDVLVYLNSHVCGCYVRFGCAHSPHGYIADWFVARSLLRLPDLVVHGCVFRFVAFAVGSFCTRGELFSPRWLSVAHGCGYASTLLHYLFPVYRIQSRFGSRCLPGCVSCVMVPALVALRITTGLLFTRFHAVSFARTPLVHGCTDFIICVLFPGFPRAFSLILPFRYHVCARSLRLHSFTFFVPFHALRSASFSDGWDSFSCTRFALVYSTWLSLRFGSVHSSPWMRICALTCLCWFSARFLFPTRTVHTACHSSLRHALVISPSHPFCGSATTTGLYTPLVTLRVTAFWLLHCAQRLGSVCVLATPATRLPTVHYVFHATRCAFSRGYALFSFHTVYRVFVWFAFWLFILVSPLCLVRFAVTFHRTFAHVTRFLRFGSTRLHSAIHITRCATNGFLLFHRFAFLYLRWFLFWFAVLPVHNSTLLDIFSGVCIRVYLRALSWIALVPHYRFTTFAGFFCTFTYAIPPTRLLRCARAVDV